MLFGAAAMLGLGEAVLATGPAARADAAAAAVLAAVKVAVGLDWARIDAVVLLVVLGVVFFWFAGRLATYSAALTLVAGLVTILAARSSGSVTGHPSHEVGAIIVLVMGALLTVFLAAGWLLGTFTMPKEGSAKPVPRLRGTRQAFTRGRVPRRLVRRFLTRRKAPVQGLGVLKTKPSKKRSTEWAMTAPASRYGTLAHPGGCRRPTPLLFV